MNHRERELKFLESQLLEKESLITDLKEECDYYQCMYNEEKELARQLKLKLSELKMLIESVYSNFQG